MGGIMYRTENLNKSYADGDGVCYALKDVNLDISKGQMVEKLRMLDNSVIWITS